MRSDITRLCRITFETTDGFKEHLDIWEIQSISDRDGGEGRIVNVITLRNGKGCCITMDSTEAAELVNRLRKDNPLVPKNIKKISRAELMDVE